MPAAVCPIGFRDLILQIRLNRGRSKGGGAETVSLQQPWGAGGGGGHRAPLPPASQSGDLSASSGDPASSRAADTTTVNSQVTENLHWEFSSELKSYNISTHVLILL